METEDRTLSDSREELSDKLEMEMVRGEEARRLLGDPLLVAAFEAIETRWTDAWRSSHPTQESEREKAYRVLFALDEFRAELHSIVQSGKFASESTDRRGSVDGRPDSID